MGIKERTPAVSLSSDDTDAKEFRGEDSQVLWIEDVHACLLETRQAPYLIFPHRCSGHFGYVPISGCRRVPRFDSLFFRSLF